MLYLGIFLITIVSYLSVPNNTIMAVLLVYNVIFVSDRTGPFSELFLNFYYPYTSIPNELENNFSVLTKSTRILLGVH